MKKEKKSRHSKMLEHRSRKTPQTHHKRPSEAREKHAKHHRSSKSPSSKRKHEEGKEHVTSKTKHEVKHSTTKADSHSGDSEPDFIAFENVLNDKGKLIQEVFEAVSEANLKTITPNSLRNCSLDELRIMCLEELHRMGNAEIIHVMSGKDPASFNPSCSTEDAKEKNMVHSLVTESNEQPKQDATTKIADSSRSFQHESSKDITSSRVTADDEHESASSGICDTKSEAESDSLELCATQKEIDSLIQEEIMNQTGAQGLAQQTKTSDLTDMEILELELRARIIRSLLRNHGMEVSDEEEKIQQKENVGLGEGNT